MATETRDVEVRMKLVLDGSGAKAVNTLTGEIVAASEAHAALAASMAKPLPTPPPSTMRRAVELTSGQPVPARFLAQKIAAEQKRPVQQVDAEIGQLIGRGHLDLTPKGLRASNMGEREA